MSTRHNGGQLELQAPASSSTSVEQSTCGTCLCSYLSSFQLVWYRTRVITSCEKSSVPTCAPYPLLVCCFLELTFAFCCVTTGRSGAGPRCTARAVRESSMRGFGRLGKPHKAPQGTAKNAFGRCKGIARVALARGPAKGQRFGISKVGGSLGDHTVACAPVRTRELLGCRPVC